MSLLRRAGRTVRIRPDVAWLALVVAAGAVLRIVWILNVTEPPFIGDPLHYFRHAQDIADGHGYRNLFNEAPTAFFPPGYPYGLAGLFWLVEHTPVPDDLVMAAAWAQAVLGTVTVALAGVVAGRLGGAAAGIGAAVLVAGFPNLVYYTSVLHLENLFMPLVLAAVAIGVTAPWAERRWSPLRIGAFGVVLGLSILVRPFSLMLLPALVVAMVAGGFGWRRTVTSAAAVIAIVVLVCTPWVVRNVRVMGEPILLSTNLGDTLCVDHRPGAHGRFAWDPWCLRTYPGGDRRQEVARNADNTRRAIRWALTHPGREASLVLWRAFYTWSDGSEGIVAVQNPDDPPLSQRWQPVAERTADAWHFAVIGMALVAVPAMTSRRRPDRLFVLLATAGLAAVPLGLYGYPRFSVPVLPLLAVLGGVTIGAATAGWPPPCGPVDGSAGRGCAPAAPTR